MTIPAEELLIFFFSLVALFSPFAAIASHSVITGRFPKKIQGRIALRIAVYLTILLIGVTWVGHWILELLGVSVPALTSTGGLALMLAAVPMMMGGSNDKSTGQREMVSEKEDWKSLVVMPLIFPLSTGASHVAYIIAESSRYDTILDQVMLSVACAFFAGVVGVTNYFSGPLDQRLDPHGRSILTRVAGIILTAIAFSLLVRGVTELALESGLRQLLTDLGR